MDFLLDWLELIIGYVEGNRSQQPFLVFTKIQVALQDSWEIHAVESYKTNEDQLRKPLLWEYI